MEIGPASGKSRLAGMLALAGWLLFGVLLACNLVFFGFDGYPVLERKLARQGLGSLGPEEFREKVVARSIALLNNPPRFHLNDETRYLLFEHLSGGMRVDPGRFGEGGAPPTDTFLLEDTSPLGLLADGVIEYAERSADAAKSLSALRRYAGRFLDGDRGLIVRPVNVEQTGQGNAMLYLAAKTGETRYREAADQIAAFYLRSFRETGRAIPYAVWGANELVLVDTLGIMCPFLARYGAETGNQAATDLAVFQLEDFLARAFDERTGLPLHGYNPMRGDGLVGVADWGRGSGWLASGLQQVVRWLPANHPRRTALVERYRSFAASLRTKQREDGTWGTMQNLSESQWDTSATAMICHFFLYGRVAGLLGPEFDDSIARALDALRRNTRRDGTLDFAQGPVADLIRHSRRWGPNLFGQGALTACLALLDDWSAVRDETNANREEAGRFLP